MSDIQRPLNERGLSDAPFMAKLLRANGAQPQAIFSSPAIRALTTAAYFKIEFGIADKDFILKDEIYEAYPLSVLLLIKSLPGEYDRVMLFGHNPTFTSVANLFNPEYLDNLPTCGIVSIQAEVGTWADFSEKTAQVQHVFYPKQYQ